MTNDKFSFTNPSLIRNENPGMPNEVNRKELIEMAAEQFASLLWQQYLSKEKTKNPKKGSISRLANSDCLIFNKKKF